MLRLEYGTDPADHVFGPWSAVGMVFRLLPHGFTDRDLRGLLAKLLGRQPGQLTAGQMTYDLRRLREHGLINRIPRTHRYQVTDNGLHAGFAGPSPLRRRLARACAVELDCALGDDRVGCAAVGQDPHSAGRTSRAASSIARCQADEWDGRARCH